MPSPLNSCEKQECVSVGNAAQAIGVSAATIRNWTKAGYIVPLSSHPLIFSREEVFNLSDKIGNKEFSRLDKRANKAKSTSCFIPEEYAFISDSLAKSIARLTNIVKQECLNVELVVFLAAIRYLELKGEVSLAKPLELFESKLHAVWKRKSVEAIMITWKESLKQNADKHLYAQVYDLLVPEETDDYIGLIYQALHIEGEKSRQGSYYTPRSIVQDCLSHIEYPVESFLDPCCGGGVFLVLAGKHFNLDPMKIYGFDCDPIATQIAKINLLLAYNDLDFSPNISCIDSLSELATGDFFCETNSMIGQIDAIATNPPWGAYKNLTSKNLLSSKIRSGETFSLFLEKSIRLLRNGGAISFILPESILKIKSHSDIRKFILDETAVKTIALLGKRFTGVFTPVIRLDLVKNLAPENWVVTVDNGSAKNKISQKRFALNEDFSFDVSLENHEECLLQKIYSVEHSTLINNAEWALGIVTGNNKKFVLDKPTNKCEVVYRGRDISAYSIDKPQSFIQFTPEAFQQVAQERFFRAPEKLIYKFISKKLAFAYDDQQRLTLNSANILIPSIPGMSMKVVLAFLNSSVFQYIFQKKFMTHKVLRGDLEKMPFPKIKHNTHCVIETFAETAIKLKKPLPDLDALVFNAFNLNKDEISIIQKSTGL